MMLVPTRMTAVFSVVCKNYSHRTIFSSYKQKKNSKKNFSEGKSKELIQKEHQARRNYSKKWGKLLSAQKSAMHNPDELNEQLRQQIPEQALNVYNYNGHGDSYFVSEDMYKMLVAKCRCGRQRNCGHVLKCMQKEKDKYEAVEKATVESQERAMGGEQIIQNNGSSVETQVSAEKITKHLSNNKEKSERQVLATTNEIIGWRPVKSRYNQWEKSMKYVSPVLTMSGHRITAIPYNAIIIG